MRIPMAVAAVATVATGILAPYFIAGSYGFFSPIIPSGTHLTALEVVREWLFEPPILLFYAALAVGAIPAYQIYVAQRIPRTELLEKYSFLRTSHQFLWNRCYINALYYRVVSSVLKVSRGTYGLVERGITAAISFAAVSVLKVSRGTYGLVERGIKAANQLTANCLVSLARGTYDYLEVQHILRPRVLGLVALAFLGKPFDSQELRTRVLSLSQETYLVTIMFFMALLLMSIILFLIVPSMFGGFV
jgi:hypothetical protein